MGQKKVVAKKQAPPEGPSSAPYSSSPSEEEDERVTSPEEEQESPDQGPDRQIPEFECSEDEEEEEHDEELEEDEENQSDSEVSPAASDFIVQAVTGPFKKPNSSSKRPMQDSEKNAAESSRKIKKAKRVAVEEAAEKNKTTSVAPFKRLWSEDDEVLILERLLDFKSSDMGVFYRLMKKSLSVIVPKERFLDKIRKLKNKFERNVFRAEKADLYRPHERKCFELSKRIWGENSNGGGGGGRRSNRARREESKNEADGIRTRRSTRARSKLNDDAVTLPGEQSGEEEGGLGEGSKGRERKDVKVDEVGNFWAMHPCLKQSFSDLSMKEPLKSFMMENMTRIGGGKARALEKKWKDLLVDEVGLYMKWVELIGEQTKLVLDAMKASKD